MNGSTDNETIFALSSGRGRAGVAVIRVSGARSGAVLEALAGGIPKRATARLRRLTHPVTEEPLDEALVLFFEGPASFTGEDVVEFHVHGGPAVIEGVLGALAAIEGLREAEPGEFARRAFEAGKIDLTQAEGLADLIEAETSAQRAQALRQSSGALKALCEASRNDIIRAASLVEAAIDFSDEADVPDLVENQARPVVAALVESIAGHLENARRGERLRDGLRVVLAGAPNAGKSSLMNALSRRDVAIVSDEPGTTRDVIEVHLDLDGYPVTLLDTAGLREAEGDIEQEGVRRTLERASEAGLVLWLVDAEHPDWTPPAALSTGELQVVLNKTDAAAPATPDGVAPLRLSVKSGEGLSGVLDYLAGTAARLMQGSEEAVVTRARQRRELETCLGALKDFLSADPLETELRAEDLRVAGTALGRITGAVDVEDILDRIFGDFCIGK